MDISNFNLGNFLNINKESLFGGLKSTLGIIFIAIIATSFIAIVWFLVRRNKKKKKEKKDQRTIVWWRTIGERMIPRNELIVTQEILPRSGIKILWHKKTKEWWPCFAEESNINTFDVAITKTGELINFSVKPIEKELEQAGINYDHRDMLPQRIHIEEIIDEDYTKKSKTWWQEYKELISVIGIVFVCAISLGIIVYFVADLVSQVSNVLSQQNTFNLEQAKIMQELAETVRSIKAGSGVY